MSQFINQQKFVNKVIERKDCNLVTLDAKAVRVDGNEINWYAQFFVSSTSFSTEMFCPIDVPVKETITSEPIVFDSYTNENLDGAVDITLIVPTGLTVEAKEIK